MTKNLALWLGILVIVVMGIIPPWKMTISVSMSSTSVEKVMPSTYGPLWDPPDPPNMYYSRSIDFSRLCIQWGLVALVTAGLMYTLPRRSGPAGIPKKQPSGEHETEARDS